MKYDVAVIGGGPAGYVAAIKAAQLGGKVILFEKETLGGTCLNRGCIPTKTYIKTAEYIHNIKHCDERGINIDITSMNVDMPRVLAHKNKVVKKLTDGVGGLLRSNGVEVIKGHAVLKSEHEIKVDDKVYEASNIILAGGSKVGMIPIEGINHKGVITSDTILDINEVPETLAIMGGGVIGCEIATAFATFGSKVTVVELADRLIPNMDKDISKAIKKSLESMGVVVLLGQKVEKVQDKAGKPVLCISGGKTVEADKILLSIGRVADLECLGALKDKVIVEAGKILVDEAMHTSISTIYAVGDINGRSMLAHSAFKMGEVAAENAMGKRTVLDISRVPGCLYTMPEAASVGMTEEEARVQNDVTVGIFPFAANGRALASGNAEGFVKVVADKKYGEILGVHIVGDAATEMIIEGSVMMEMEITIHEGAEIIHPHPTYGEAFMEACADALGKCIHLPKKK